jgi:hypothetical protein
VTEEAPFTSTKLVGAKVEFIDGANAGKSATTSGDGRYQITGVAQGGFTMRVTANGYREQSLGVTVTSNLSRDFRLSPAGPRTKFGPGQYRVNSEIAPGRYFSRPDSGCYFERLRGFSGSINDIIANEFLGYDAGQWIVDIKSSDLAFEADSECGIWQREPFGGAQSPVTAGMWLVNSQVRSGTYTANTSPGCYWERLRDFSNTLNGVIANDFVSGGGRRNVSIRSSDLGFATDDECGAWTRTSGVETPAFEADFVDLERIVVARQRHRMRDTRLVP